MAHVQEDQPQNTHRTPWVQCDGCYKWRKMPWFVNTELLGEKFFCSDNKWNLEEASCEVNARHLCVSNSKHRTFISFLACF